MRTLTKPDAELESGTLGECLSNNFTLKQIAALLSAKPFKADLIVWNLTEEMYREQVLIAIDWILSKNKI